MEITSPRRLLALGGPDSGILDILKRLTGNSPPQPQLHASGDNDCCDDITTSIAGLSHTWDLETRYYRVQLPIWIDEIADAAAWRRDFTSSEAGEVVRAVGAWVYVFRKPGTETDVRHVQDALDAVEAAVRQGAGRSWDGVMIAVATEPGGGAPRLERSSDEWEELCQERGFEFVDAEQQGKNEFGESLGLARLREALEANDWEADDDDLADAPDSDLDDNETLTRDPDAVAVADEVFGSELADLKAALERDGDEGARGLLASNDKDEESQVLELEGMMRKLQAVKEMGESMEENERKRFAARAVANLAKQL